MSRFRRIIHGAASGYGLLVAASIYSLASVPLALHYLSKERFGLWAVMSIIGNYLSQIDLGMSGAVSRMLVDQKDHPESGNYGSLIKTGWLVSFVQGMIILGFGFLLAPTICKLEAIPAHLQNDFIALVRWQSLILALGFAIRIFNQILQAHQRVDLVNYCQMAMLGLGFVWLTLFFHTGQGVYSMVWVNLIGIGCTALFLSWSCFRLRLFPRAGNWGHPSWPYFKELFTYGKDLFLVALGSQLILSSQVLIITRRLGLEVALAWAIGTRAFNLISQCVWRIADVSWPGFTEMMVRGESTKLRERYKALVVLSASFGVFAAVGFATCNSLFVTVLTHGKLQWPAVNDVLLGAWMIVGAPLHCHTSFVLLTKKIGFIRYVYLVEGIVYVICAFLVAKSGGLPAIIACSVICSILFSGAYGVWRIADYFNLSIREVGFEWLAPMARVLGLLVIPTAGAWWVLRGVREPIIHLAVLAVFSGGLGFYLFLRYGLPTAFQTELMQRAPKRVNPILRRVFQGSFS